jgi:hypothetical protein
MSTNNSQDPETKPKDELTELQQEEVNGGFARAPGGEPLKY